MVICSISELTHSVAIPSRPAQPLIKSALINPLLKTSKKLTSNTVQSLCNYALLCYDSVIFLSALQVRWGGGAIVLYKTGPTLL